jgi:plasmid stabilization system protein ParE
VCPARFTEAARAELIDAQDWYEAEAPGLGRRFRTEIDSVVRSMADNPRQFPTVFKTLVEREETPLRALFPH